MGNACILEDRLTSLPTDVLHNICRAVQLRALTPSNLRVNHEYEYSRKAEDPELRFLRAAFRGLRQSCKLLRSVNDRVRTSVCFSVEEMDNVEPYLSRLPNLNTAVVVCDSDAPVITSCLQILHNTAPGLDCLTLRYAPSADQPNAVCSKGPMSDIEVSCLLPWHGTLRHLALQNIRFSGLAATSPFNLSWLSQFASLQSLDLSNVSPTLAPTDLKGCTALQKLSISPSGYDQTLFVALDLSHCTLLRELRCTSCHLKSLDVSTCPGLEILDVRSNGLKSLDLSRNPALKQLLCHSNKLKTLRLTDCPQLEVVRLSHNPLTDAEGGLQLAGCSALKELGVQYTRTSNLDLSGCSSLTTFASHCASLHKVDFSGCTSLVKLVLWYVPLGSVNLTGCSNLVRLECALDSLTSINLTGCTALTSLDLKHTSRLTTLDLSACKSTLVELSLIRSGLLALNLQGCHKLQKLDCKSCKISGLDLMSCVGLRELRCSGNSLTCLDVSPCAALVKLDCSSNPLEALCTEGCSKLVSVNCPTCVKEWTGIFNLEPLSGPFKVVEIACPHPKGYRPESCGKF